MRGLRLHVSAAALLVLALLYYLCRGELLLAVLVPAAAHELGHVLALLLLGLRIKGFRVELRGFCIEYYGFTGALGHALAAAAGPLAGFLYALAAAWWGRKSGSGWLYLSAGVSALLSLFNLLPALPLDGGRILGSVSSALWGEERGRALTELAGLLVGLTLLAAGAWLLLRGQGAACELAAVWLLLYQENGRGIVKSREMI